MQVHTNRQRALAQALAQSGVDGFILPANDEFMNEYVPAAARRLEWLTGFTGSAGTLAMCGGRNAFFTDGRYILQAQREVGGDEIGEQHNSALVTPDEWLVNQAREGAVIGYDPALHTASQLKRFEKEGQRKHITWKPLHPNPVDAIWGDRPAPPASGVLIYPECFSGHASGAKRRLIADDLQTLQADALMLTAPDSICWLLDIRGADVPYTPFVLCHALLHADATVTLFLDESRVDGTVRKALGADVRYAPVERLAQELAALKGKTVLYDPVQSPALARQWLERAGAFIRECDDPCQLPKACKNKTEIEAIRETHRHDGLAVTRFLHHLSEHWQAMDEQAVSDRLLEERRKMPFFIEPSFHTIAGSGPHGAIVHYRATPQSNSAIAKDTLLLVDSGGQYFGGTTDITRTIAIGNPPIEMKENFTRVLKGHIALACAVFPEGTTGSQLDALARQYLWQAGLDYDHGTGHGVGACLSVHEGPQRISKRASAVALRPGMVIFGTSRAITKPLANTASRIESLVVVTGAAKAPGFLGFEILTLVPIDRHATQPSMLTQEEKDWLNHYHQRVYDAHAPHLDKDAHAWLRAATAPI